MVMIMAAANTTVLRQQITNFGGSYFTVGNKLVGHFTDSFVAERCAEEISQMPCWDGMSVRFLRNWVWLSAPKKLSIIAGVQAVDTVEFVNAQRH